MALPSGFWSSQERYSSLGSTNQADEQELSFQEKRPKRYGSKRRGQQFFWQAIFLREGHQVGAFIICFCFIPFWNFLSHKYFWKGFKAPTRQPKDPRLVWMESSVIVCIFVTFWGRRSVLCIISFVNGVLMTPYFWGCKSCSLLCIPSEGSSL